MVNYNVESIKSAYGASPVVSELKTEHGISGWLMESDIEARGLKFKVYGFLFEQNGSLYTLSSNIEQKYLSEFKPLVFGSIMSLRHNSSNKEQEP